MGRDGPSGEDGCRAHRHDPLGGARPGVLVVAGDEVPGVDRPELVGLYTYSCGFSGPYYRRAEPSKPLLADELPEPLRAVIGGLRLSGLSFATTQSFDPETFVACQRYR